MFTMRDMDATAPAYNHFRTFFEPAADCSDSLRTTAPGRTSGTSLFGRQIPIDAVPQQLEYDRGNDIELWHIWLKQYG